MNPLSPTTHWVWPAHLGRSINRYLEVRHPFALETCPRQATLYITADARYAAWLNGTLIATGPFPDWPQTRSVDTWNVEQFLRSGENVLTVMVHELGVDTASYVDAPAGLAYELRCDGNLIAFSGMSTAQWRPSPAFRSGPIARITPQLPFTFEYDGRNDDGWTEVEYAAGSGWTTFTAADGSAWEAVDRRFRPRPFPAPLLGDRVAGSLVAQGLFRRAGREAGVAVGLQRDWLSPRSRAELFANATTISALTGEPVTIRHDTTAEADGVYFVIDLGGEAVGYLEFEFTAVAGTLIEFSFGEHLDDLRVRAHVGGRNFASSLRARGGRQTFTYPLARVGARHLQLHISNGAGGFALTYAGLRRLSHSIPQRGEFASTDELQNRIHATAVNTLRLCMLDHYDDCPWREQGLYANDMLNQSLAGYYAFGDYRFAQVSLELLAGGLGDDGVLELCAPARIPITIPGFTMSWILALDANLRFSGDVAFARAMFPTVQAVIGAWLQRSIDGLIPSLRGPRYWHFYDWTSGGLDGTVDGDCTRFAELQSERFDAPLNALFIMGLTASARLAEALGDHHDAHTWRHAASAMRQTFHTTFWQASSADYATFVDRHAQSSTHSAELTQALALWAGCCPEMQVEPLQQRLLSNNNGWIRASLSQSIHKFEACLETARFGDAVMKAIDEDWGSMLFRNATTFWETLNGSSDFDGAGSLCHGWSATPVYFFGAYGLGIRPLKPGFKTFSVSPPASHTRLPLRGVVPTPHGDISVHWSAVNGKPTLRISYPEATVPILAPSVCVRP